MMALFKVKLLKVTQVGLPTGCSWNSAQLMGELSTIFIFHFPGKYSLWSTEAH